MTVQAEGLTEDLHADEPVGINDLPAELLAAVVSHLPRTASVANSLAGVCLTWRAAILAEDSYLQGVHFELKDAAQPFRGLAPVRGAVAHRRTWQTRDGRFNDIGAAVVRAGANGTGVPKVLARAAECHNVSALETLGTLRDMQGDHAAAFKAWKKSAMLGSSVGQFKLGEIFYRGLGNQGVDGEEALFWLNKAAKNPTLDLESLAMAAVIIGFLHLDGEGTQPCNVTAVKWFKVAAEHGNKEADQTLGWLYNTGQY